MVNSVAKERSCRYAKMQVRIEIFDTEIFQIRQGINAPIHFPWRSIEHDCTYYEIDRCYALVALD